MYSADANTIILITLSVGGGVITGLVTKRMVNFVLLILIGPVAIAGGFYLAEVIHLRGIGHSSSESWAGLVMPLLSAASFAVLAPTAFITAGIKRIFSRRKSQGRNR